MPHNEFFTTSVPQLNCASDSNPVMVEVIRNHDVESYHRGAAVIIGVDGRVHAQWGNIKKSVYQKFSILIQNEVNII